MVRRGTAVNITLIILTAGLSLLLQSCGGGGSSGSEYRPAAEVAINASPGNIDPGDRTFITVHVWNVHPDGILLNVRYPVGLSWVRNTGHFQVDGREFVLTPDLTEADSEYVYLVFAFSMSDFGENGQSTGVVTFQLQAVTDSISGEIGVDPKIRVPDVPVKDQFDIENPLFGAKAEDNINVSGPNAEPTSTPSS